MTKVRVLSDASFVPKRRRKSNIAPSWKELPPVDGATLALAKLMQAAHDFEEAAWSGRISLPRTYNDRHD